MTPKSPAEEAERLALAKIIHPEAFDGTLNGYVGDLSRDERDGLRANEQDARDVALSKADAILARSTSLRPGQAEAVREAEQIASEIYRIAGANLSRAQCSNLAAAILALETRQPAKNWCPRCGCGNDVAGFAHLQNCPGADGVVEIQELVKAVNNHDALVKALRESAADIVGSCRDPEDPYIAEALRRIGDVLAVVGGR